MEATLLVELLTEELPPKALRDLGQKFFLIVLDELASGRFIDSSSDVDVKLLATPRRLAVLVPDVRDQASDVERRIPGPSTKAPSEAVHGFAKKAGVSLQSLKKEQGPKGEIYVASPKVKGENLAAVLAARVDAALKVLSVPKLMRWGDSETAFVRPVHGFVMMHGQRVVPGSVFGLTATNETQGHRFMGSASIALSSADEYEARLAEDGMVIVDFVARRTEIDRQLQLEAQRRHASLGSYQDLLDEVTALVEHPTVYAGGFDPSFLEVPQECLILTMRQNQKYFPLFDAAGRLKPQFLIVSNMKVDDPRHIIGGNERVVRPRFEDARFFFNQDRKTRLEARVPQLAKVVYHNKLGSQLERVQRLQLLAGSIARELKADVVLAERAAWLAKADLLTGMVGEFPELQGTMGRYYALHDGEPKAVADAIGEHYCPRFAGDRLPEGLVACSVALADKLDVLVGMFGVMEQPTGEKDPFGLRRTGLGVVRILIEQSIPLRLDLLIADADATFTPRLPRTNTVEAVFLFILERARGYLREKGFSALEVEAVLPQQPEAAFDEHAVQRESRLDLLLRRIEAVREFQKLPEAEHLAAANKRIRNILRQSNFSFDGVADPNMFENAAERELYKETVNVRAAVEFNFSAHAYKESLFALASLRPCVDRFFDNVLVNADDPKTRENRLRLLGELAHMMNRVADISKLAQ